MNKTMWSLKTLNLILFTFNTLLVPTLLSAQPDPEALENEQILSYQKFLNKLAHHNLELAAERYNLDIADAEVEAAKILPDPELSFTGNDNQQRRMKMGYGFEAEIEWDVELGGKRKARRHLANEERQLAELELHKYFQKLRRNSTLDYLKALRNKMHYEVQKESFITMLDLAERDSLRHEAGSPKTSTARQTRLEVSSLYNNLQDAADDWQYSLMDIKSKISETKHDTIYIPEGKLESFERIFELNDLIQKAIDNCPDLNISRQHTSVSKSKVKLAKAERAIDLGLSLGVENNSFEKNTIGPTPGHTSVFAGISVPLKFSNNKESGLKIAKYRQEQTKLSHTAKELKLEKEITKAFQNYQTRQQQIKGMKSNVKEAKEIFKKEKESYLNDDSSLVEVLYAERTYNKLQRDYINTLYKHASALVELESTVGIWDIDF